MEGINFVQMAALTPLQPLAPVKSIESIGSLEPGQKADAPYSFGKYLSDAINQLNALQLEANVQSNLLLTGSVEDFHTPIIALEKPSLALGMATTVRNRLLEAYQEIMRLQI